MPDAVTPAQTTSTPSKGQVFLSRLSSTLGLWAVITVALWLKLDWLLLAMMGLVGVLGTWEYVRLQNADGGSQIYSKWSLLVSVFYWSAVLFICVPSGSEPPWWLDAAVLVCGVQGIFIITFSRPLEGEQTLRRIFGQLFGLVYTILLWGFMARLLLMDEAASGRHMVLLVILVTKFGDMGAYILGSLFGKHKMIPHISPGKTWEGFAGAILSAYLGTIILLLLAPDSLLPLSWGSAMILAPMLAIWGVMGDLAESVLKRCHQIKDSGHKLPGIGGILDLTDSLLFTAPLAYFYLKVIA